MIKDCYNGWTSREWNLMLWSLNKELPPEECGVKLNEEEQKNYLKSLAFLKEERKKNPGIPIEYSICEKEF